MTRQLFLCLKGLESAALILMGSAETGNYGAVTKELNRLLRICSNNLNQYAKRANETGSIYKADIEDLQRRLDAIWQQQKELLTELAGIE